MGIRRRVAPCMNCKILFSFFEKKVKDLSLDSNIHFIGLVQKHIVVEWYKKAIASFVVFKNFPVLGTSSPNKMFDSFAAGVPVINNTLGWIKDLIKNEDCGINVLPNNSLEMRNAILKMVDDINFQKVTAKNALRLAQTEFNRDLLSEKYMEALLEILKHK